VRGSECFCGGAREQNQKNEISLIIFRSHQITHHVHGFFTHAIALSTTTVNFHQELLPQILGHLEESIALGPACPIWKEKLHRSRSPRR
jgi:hypothetical protein